MMTQKTPFTSAKWARLILIVGDLITLILFVYTGQRDHGTANANNLIQGILMASWEFALVWLVVGWPLGAFPRMQDWTIFSLLTRPILTWLVAAPLGILLRAIVLNRLNIPTLFFAATLGFGLLYLLAWRILIVLAWRATTRRQ